MTDPRNKTEIAADYEAEIGRLKEQLAELQYSPWQPVNTTPKRHIINHPIGKPGVEYDIVTVLLDLAAQENCDGEPYDQMQQAGEYIKALRAEIEKLRHSLTRIASYTQDQGLLWWQIEARDALENTND